MAEVSLRNVVKRFDNIDAVRSINLDIPDSEFVVLVGPSGCGKSTTLRMIAGLEEVTSGDIFIGGEIVNDRPPKDRDIAMVFQNYALYPHMTAFENMSFGLKLRKFPKDEIKKRVDQAARILDITELPAGQRLRLAVDQLDDIQHARGLVDPRLDLGLGVAFQAKPERHVFRDCHVRIERVVLEHHRDVAVLWRHIVDDVAPDHDVAVGDVLKAGDHPQRGRFSAAGRPDQHDKLMVGDVEIDAAHRLDVVVTLDNLTQGNVSHRYQPFVAPAVRPAM